MVGGGTVAVVVVLVVIVVDSVIVSFKDSEMNDDEVTVWNVGVTEAEPVGSSVEF
jgi:hypothetical protein